VWAEGYGRSLRGSDASVGGVVMPSGGGLSGALGVGRFAALSVACSLLHSLPLSHVHS
jgi:hypothetical protein